MTIRKATLLFVAAALVVVVTPVLAQDACQGVSGNLIVNCGFETGDFTGWTQSGNTGGTSVTNNPADVWSGTFAASLGPVGSDGFLTQSFNGNSFSFQFRQDVSNWALDSVVVTPFVSCGTGCETYFVSFWLQNDGGPTNDFTLLWNGVDVGPSLVDASGFAYTNFTGYVDGNASTVPEPGSLILMGSGLLGLAAVVRRKLLL